MKYFVTLKYEDTMEVEADNEEEAIKLAEVDFDPTRDGPTLVEVWTDNEEDNYYEF
jgi:hypothetical protein